MSMSDLVKQHELESEGEKVVWLPNSASDELLVIFAAFQAREKYQHLKWFATNRDVNLLFIRDTRDTFYIERDQGLRYQAALSKFTSQFQADKTTFYGSSMGGYGALFHGIRMEANIICYNPQIDGQTTISIAYKDLAKAVSLMGDDFVNLQTLIEGKRVASPIYFMHGQHPLDVANANLFFGAKPEYLSLIRECRNEPDHYIEVGVRKLHERRSTITALRRIRYEYHTK